MQERWIPRFGRIIGDWSLRSLRHGYTSGQETTAAKALVGASEACSSAIQGMKTQTCDNYGTSVPLTVTFAGI